MTVTDFLWAGVGLYLLLCLFVVVCNLRGM